MLEQLLTTGIAYDMGDDIKTIRKRKYRKGKSHHRYSKVVTTIMTSKEIAEIIGQTWLQVMKDNPFKLT